MNRARFAVQDCEFHHLYIVRYALTHEKNKTFESYPLLRKRGGIIKGTVSNCPWDFQYTLRALRKGFIYVYNDGVWGEFTVAEKETVCQTPFRIKVNPDWRQLYIAYSELGWSEDYRAYLLSHPEIMAQRMQLVKLQGDPKGNEHSANVDDYSALVEEYRENPGCLKSLSGFLPKLFQPLDLSYSGDWSRYLDEVGWRWRCSAIPFGRFDKRHPLEVLPQQMRYDKALPKVNAKPYQQDSLLKPAPWTLPPAQKKSPPIHPFIIAVEDPLGEARDLNMVYQYSLEDIETYMDYYYYTLLLANFFEETHISEHKNVVNVMYDSGGTSTMYIKSPREKSTSDSPHTLGHVQTKNKLDEYVPGHPWFAFLKKYEKETREMYAAMAAYIKPWTTWLLEKGIATVMALRTDFSLDPPHEDADFSGPCEEIMAAMLNGMGDIPEAASSLEDLFNNSFWSSFFQSCLLTTHRATQATEVLVEVLGKAATVLIAQGKGNDIIKYKTQIHNRIAEKLPRLSPIRKVDNLEDAPISSMTAAELISYVSEHSLRTDRQAPSGRQKDPVYELDSCETRLSLDKYMEYFSGSIDVAKEIFVPDREGMSTNERHIRIIMNSVVVLFFACKSYKTGCELAKTKQEDHQKKVKKIVETSNAVAGFCVATVSFGNFPKLVLCFTWAVRVLSLIESAMNIAESLQKKRFLLAGINATIVYISLFAILPGAIFSFPVSITLWIALIIFSVIRDILESKYDIDEYFSNCFWKKNVPTPFSYDKLFKKRDDKSINITLPTDEDLKFFVDKLNTQVNIKAAPYPMNGPLEKPQTIFCIDCHPALINGDSIKIKIEEKLADETEYCPLSTLTTRSKKYKKKKNDDGTMRFIIYIESNKIPEEIGERYRSNKLHRLYTRLSVEYQGILDSSIKTVKEETFHHVFW